MNGRFAPSPTGALHLGNLRTALLAWLFARSAGSRFLVRMEDLDAAVSRPEHEAGQLADLAALGLDGDGSVVRQSTRLPLYAAAVARLEAQGLVYPCYCTRREIQAAASAPNGPQPDGAYPGTCRSLTAAERAERERAGRRPARRLRTDGRTRTIVDRQLGPFSAVVDDVVLVRNDGTYAYNLAVVVDDDEQGVAEVVRADDLLSSSPRQAHLADLLGLRPVAYAHVPLVLAPDGTRLAKRHGAVTLADRLALGDSVDAVRARLLASVGLPGDLTDALAAFDPAALPRTSWVLTAAEVGAGAG